MEAVIESVQVQRGDLVKKGQVIATLESGPERASLELAKSRATMQGDKRGQVIVTLESGPERAALDLAKSRATMQGELNRLTDASDG